VFNYEVEYGVMVEALVGVSPIPEVDWLVIRCWFSHKISLTFQGIGAKVLELDIYFTSLLKNSSIE
jgi:hypothetical protein